MQQFYGFKLSSILDLWPHPTTDVTTSLLISAADGKHLLWHHCFSSTAAVFVFVYFTEEKNITAIHEETCLLRKNGFWNMKGTNNAYLTINWVYRYIFYLLVCLLVCVSYMEWQLKTWKINQQLLPHQTDTTPRRNCICCYISTLTWVGLSFCPSQIYTNTHPFTQHVHTHISSPIYFAQNPSLPPHT